MEIREQAAASVLPEPVWRERRGVHEARLDPVLGPHRQRRRERLAHPVEDFLFTYYSQRPAALRRWHPGFGTTLAGGAEDYAGLKGYAAVGASDATVPASYVCSQEPLLRALSGLLRATASRPAQLGCFGMHEWAMVYGLAAEEVRHEAVPLRLGSETTDQVVSTHRVACSHFDAFRFFTDDARPLNRLQPTAADRADLEQPGCLHAGMDLYKHAFRLTPMVCSDLVVDCFELAREIRVLDMRASPYDLSGLGYEPVPVETAAGKAEYVAAQRGFAERGAPLRERLIAECDRLLAVPSA